MSPTAPSQGNDELVGIAARRRAQCACRLSRVGTRPLMGSSRSVSLSSAMSRSRQTAELPRRSRSQSLCALIRCRLVGAKVPPAHHVGVGSTYLGTLLYETHLSIRMCCTCQVHTCMQYEKGRPRTMTDVPPPCSRPSCGARRLA